MATIPLFGSGQDLPFLSWRVAKKASSAFTGGTTNAHGDYDGTGNPYTLFTVTGDVVIHSFHGIVNTDLTGATATLSVGVAGNTTGLTGSTTATNLLDGDVWNGNVNNVGVGNSQQAFTYIAINDGADIIETAGTANITAGQIDYYCIWAPLEEGATVVAA